MSASPKILLAAFVMCCVVASAYGSISCLWTGADGKEQKVNCTNAANKYCIAIDVTYNGKKSNFKGCSGETQYGTVVVDASKNMKVEPNCTKDGDTGNQNFGLFEADMKCCSGKDYCNSGGRVGVGFGLITVVVGSLVAKAML